ncbi:MAG TPA: hypothetical protein PKY87_02200, partial [Terricaulis sp.]|nr:hypothetical protein [Terricaulis sp.]
DAYAYADADAYAYADADAYAYADADAYAYADADAPFDAEKAKAFFEASKARRWEVLLEVLREAAAQGNHAKFDVTLMRDRLAKLATLTAA